MLLLNVDFSGVSRLISWKVWQMFYICFICSYKYSLVLGHKFYIIPCSYGYLVAIQYEGEFETRYGHCCAIHSRVGQVESL